MTQTKSEVIKLSTFIYQYPYQGPATPFHLYIRGTPVENQWENLTFPPLSIITLELHFGINISFLFLSFRRVLNVIYSFLGNSPASEF